MCTTIAANAASALSIAQVVLVSKVLAVCTIAGVVLLNFRSKLRGLLGAIPRALKV